MATTNTNKVMNNNGTTTLVCGNCGAELVIPNTSTFMVGMTMGKDSNLGTVVAPTVNHPHQHVPKITPEMLANNPDLLNLVSSIMNAIDDGGFLDVQDPRIVRRWVISQALNMVTSNYGSFHKCLNWKGYKYSWKVLINDLNAQEKLFADGNIEEFDIRRRFYNKEVAIKMAWHYMHCLKKHMDSMDRHKCKGKEYIFLRTRDNWRGTFVNDIDKIVEKFKSLCDEIIASASISSLKGAVEDFYDAIGGIRFNPDKTAPAFQNAYKAVGGYYTVKDLIMFEGCRFGRLSQEESLEYLESYAHKIEHEGISDNGYKFIGMLKEFISENNFDYKVARENWKKQSELRKAARKIAKNRRPRN